MHPDFAYGIHADFASGKSFRTRVRIELIDMEFGSEYLQSPLLIPLDLQHIQGHKIRSKIELENLTKKYIAFCGFRTGMHYKKASRLFTLNNVIDLIEKVHSRKINLELNESYRKTLRLLNYCLYNDLEPTKFANKS